MPTLQEMKTDLAAQYQAFIAYSKEESNEPEGDRREKGEKMFNAIEALKAKVEQKHIEERRANEARTYLDEQKKPVVTPPFQGNAHSNGTNGQEMAAYIQSQKTVGELLTEHETYKAFCGKHADQTRYQITLPRSIKQITNVSTKEALPPAPEQLIATGVIKTTAGFPPFVPRTPRIMLQNFQPPTIRDLEPSSALSTAGFQYMAETTFTSGALAVLEGSVKPQSMLAYTPVNVFAETIATYVVVTNQQLDDVPQMRNLIDNRVGYMIDLKEDYYLLNGIGTSPEIQGFLTVTGLLTQSLGTDKLQDAIFKAITKVWTTSFTIPSGVVMHPTDWQTLRLTVATGSGLYYFGPPTEVGIRSLWGLPVVLTTQIPVGSALVGAFSTEAEILDRMVTTVAVGLVNDDFIKNQQTIRVEERIAHAIYRPSAFCKLVA
jgi:hypothetical protein